MQTLINPKYLISFRASAKLVGMSERGLRYYLTEDGEPKFPNPVAQIDDRPCYDRRDVLEWAKAKNSAKANSSAIKKR